MIHTHTEYQSNTHEAPDATLASYWLWLGIMLLLLVAGRATNRPAVSLPARHLPATITRPNSNALAAQNRQLISPFVKQ